VNKIEWAPARFVHGKRLAVFFIFIIIPVDFQNRPTFATTGDMQS